MTVAVFYATRQGQTRRIADHIADNLRTHGIDVHVCNVRVSGAPDWTRYSTAVLAASVHLGKHEAEMIKFVKRNRSELERCSAAFISVSLSQAGAQDPSAPADRRTQATADVQRMIDLFVQQTGWTPAHVLPAAGALAYSQYNFLIRFVLKRIARANGAPTDTSRDYEFTDWTAVDRFVHETLAVG